MIAPAFSFFRKRAFYFEDLRRLYRINPPDLKWRFWFTVALQTLRSILETCSIFIIALFTQSVSSPYAFRQRSIYKILTSRFPDSLGARLQDDRALIIFMCLMVVAFIVLKNIVACLTRVVSLISAERFNHWMRNVLYSLYFKNEYVWHVSKKKSRLVECMAFRTQLVGLQTLLLELLGNAMCAAFMFCMLFSIDASLIGSVVFVFSMVSLTVYSAIRKRVDHAGGELTEITSRLGRAERIAQRGIREILVYRKQKIFLDSILKHSQASISPKVFLSISSNIPLWFLEISGFAVIFGYIYHMLSRGTPVSAIVASMSILLLTAWRILPLVSRCVSQSVAIRGIRARAHICLSFLEESDAFTAPHLATECHELFRLRHGIELRNVTFAYPGIITPSIRNISLDIRKGERIGVIGPSGAGKTTLGLVIGGIFPATSGTVCVDGIPLEEEHARSRMRLRIGYVSQKPFIFPGTIAENVAFCDWGDEIDMAAVCEACRKACVNFLGSGQKGLERLIGEDGDGLSGGEAQRVTIARALYEAPEILVLDEATNALDLMNENAISAMLTTMDEELTTIVIAHRLSTVRTCSMIIWLERGEIWDVGSPDKVLPRYLEYCAKHNRTESTNYDLDILP